MDEMERTGTGSAGTTSTMTPEPVGQGTSAMGEPSAGVGTGSSAMGGASQSTGLAGQGSGAVEPAGSGVMSGSSGSTTSTAESVESVAAIARHPLHPVVVPLPIGALVGAFLADVAYMRSKDPFWARGARHLTEAGIATGLLAGSLGAMDFTGRQQIRQHPEAWIHAAGNVSVLGLGLVSRVLRGRDKNRTPGAGIAISGLSLVMLLVTGWLGGELSYRHRIGVIADGR